MKRRNVSDPFINDLSFNTLYILSSGDIDGVKAEVGAILAMKLYQEIYGETLTPNRSALKDIMKRLRP